MTNTDDIRTTGPVGLKGLSAEQRRRIQQARQQAVLAYRNRYNPPIEDTSEVQRYSPEEGMASWGSSSYDNPIQPTYLTSGEMQDTRYENQPWYDTLANGIGKMLGTAGTTFVSSLVGLPAGIVTAVGEQRWSGLWDNDVTNGLAQVDDWLEKNMTNYKSQEQEQNKWWQNIGSMNWWADDVIKNMGFTLGAAASMAVGSGGLGLLSKGLGLVKNVSNAGKMANNFLSALFSATGEGMIEARQGVEERNKLELQRLDNALNPEYTALQNQEDLINQQYQATGDYQSYRQQMADLLAQRQELDNKREQGLQQIEESGRLMGNKILLANQGLLTLGNMIQFGKTMTKSFDKARHAAEVSSKAAKPSWVSAQRVSNNIKDGYQVTGKGAGRLAAATKGLLTEGSEEMNQQWIQSASGAYYNKEDVNDYWKAKLNHDAVKDTAEGLHAFNQAISQGFRESWGDIDQWEQFVIGGLTGMAGSYAPTKLFNQDKTKKLFDPRRYGEWSGGAYNEIRDFNKEYNQYAENIDDVNKILASDDFFGRVRDFVGHTYTEGNKTVAAENNDKKQWKDEDDKQMIHDVQAFLRAGKLDDLRAIYQEMGDNLSDDDIDNIVKSTTKEVTQEEDKQNYAAAIDEQIAEHQRKITQLNQQAQDIAEAQEGIDPSERSDYQVSVTPALENIFAQIDDENDAITNLQQQKEGYAGQKYYEGAYVDRQGNRTKTNDEIREEIKHNAEELDRKVDSYLDSIDYVNQRTNGQLTKDQEDNLAYLHNVGSESVERMSKIMSNIRQQLPQKLLFKTDKTPEQLSKENASSDRAFSKNEDTREGYVEVDTSLMNDRAFADFFQREIMRGGNIRPEFGETAEEKVAREEEEKGLPEEEKKKRAKERVTKKWQESIKHQQDEANEQRIANLELIEKAFRENSKNNGRSRREEDEGLQQLWQDMLDAGELYNQAGAYFATLEEYIKNPQLIDEAKEKEENKASKDTEQRQTKNKFAGKTARQMNQEVASGELDIDDLDDFADMDLSDVTDDDFKVAQEEAKKSREIRQKGAALRSNIQENLGDNPSAEDIDQAELAMQMITNAELNAESPDDINIEAPEINQIPIDQIPTDLDADALDTLSERVQEMISDSFNAFQEAEDAKEIIPDEAPENPDVSGVEMPETGKDPVTKVEPEVVAPKATSNTESKNDVPVAKSPLAESALDNIIHEMQRVYDRTSTNGVWRSTTTRHPYGRSTGTYHENVAKVQFGENSIEYKRSKAIWEYLNSVGAFDRQDNSDNDRIKEGDTIHFMVRLLEGVQKDFSELTDEEKPYSLVILMLNDKGEVLGDLPLAQLEPSYKSGNMTQQVKDLLSLQEKIFDAFTKNRLKGGTLEAIVDSGLHKDATDNLNLTFDNRAKTPLVSKVKQVMNGVVPFRKSEIYTLNDVADGQPFELGIQVTGNNVAIKKGDKTQHRNIRVPKIGSLGQPYILLPTAAGNKMAVPFYMKPFDAEKHQNTEFYKILSNAVFYLVNTLNTSPSDRSEYFRKHIDVIEGLLQVKRQEGAEQVIEVTKDSVTLHLQSLTDPEQKINVSVPNTGDNIQIAKALANALSGIPINVSLQYLNNTIETGIANNEKYTRSYNQVIGEIADVNLPKGTHQTTNNWFTVELVAPSTGVKKSLGVRTRTTGVYTEVIGGRRVEIDTDKLEARDADGELIEDDEEINLMLAQIKANKPLYRDKDYIKIDVGGETRTYDVKNKKFIKSQPQKLPNVLPAPSQAIPSASPQGTDDMNIGGIDSSEVANGRVIFDGVQSKPVNSATAKQQPTEPKDDNPMALPTSKKDAEDALRNVGKQMKDAMNTSGDIEEMEALLELGQVAIDQARAAGVGEGIIKNIEGIRKGLQVKYNNHKRAKREGSSKPIDILVGWAEGRISGEDAIKQLDGTEYVKHTKGSPILGTKDSVHLSNKVEWELGKYIKEKYPFLTYGNASVATGVSTFGGNMNLTVVRDAEGNEYGTPSNFLRSLATNPNGKAVEAVKKGLETVSRNPNKTIQEIEEEMKKNKTVTRQNKDAWAAIPDELKLRLVNDGAALQLDYNGKRVTISLANRNEFVKELSNANMPAKTGSLTVTEAVKPMERKGIVTDREKEKAAKRWLAKNLPMLNSEERTLFVEKIIRNGDNAYKMWGSYRSGVIEIQRNAPIGTVYHEAFHYVMDMILSDEERRSLLDVAREEYGVQDDWTAEERLANDFRRYAIDENATGIVGRIKKWIRRLRDKITRHSMISDTTVRQLFWKINNGEFAKRSVDVEKFEDVQQRVLREIRNVQQEKYIWQNLSEGTKNNLKDAGLTEKIYQNMSLEEKEQYVRCRG